MSNTQGANLEAAAGKVKEGIKQTAQTAEHITKRNVWFERLARLGYGVRGLLYITVGLLSVDVALGHGGETTSKTGALEAISLQPFGKFLLAVIIVGLVGYSLWGFVRAIFDPFNRGTGPKGLAQRAGYVVSGLSYGALVLPAVRLLLGSGSSDNGAGGAPARGTTEWLFHQPFGPWLVGIAGIVSIIGGGGQLLEAVTAGFRKDFEAWKMRPDDIETATRVGRVGHAARGVVFALIGFFLVQAALHTDANQIRGLDGALQALASQPYGPWLLGLVALGLVAFGIFSVMCARWIRIGGES